MGALALLTRGATLNRPVPDEKGGQMDEASALNLLLLWMLIQSIRQ
jgi:hypothetical protein